MVVTRAVLKTIHTVIFQVKYRNFLEKKKRPKYFPTRRMGVRGGGVEFSCTRNNFLFENYFNFKSAIYLKVKNTRNWQRTRNKVLKFCQENLYNFYCCLGFVSFSMRSKNSDCHM